ncbi:hypothetical protein [Sphingorhabdus lutea]|nr:hypothetical protein [Sphingorhabdus lutea]
MKILIKYFMIASLVMGGFALSGCSAQDDRKDKSPSEISPFPLA